MAPSFAYVKPRSLPEVFATLDKHGALTTHRAIEYSADIRKHRPLLAAAAPRQASTTRPTGYSAHRTACATSARRE